MKIYDESGKIIAAPDLSKGWLETQQRVVRHHPAQPKVPAVTHIETMAGTHLRTIVVDTPAIPEKPAWDEYEHYQVYHPYTELELLERNKPTAEERLTAVENAVMELMLGGATNV